MPYAYSALKSEYRGLLNAMVVTRKQQVERAADRIIKLIPRYRDVESATGVSAVWLAGINERESGSDFRTYLGNGQSLSRVTTIVPKGRGPFASWEAGAKDALHQDRMDQVKFTADGWNSTTALYQAEAWNGFGPRARGIHTGYLWAGTNHYKIGKYVADGRWDPSHIDEQLGCVPVMWALIARDPSLAFDPSQNFIAPSVVPPQSQNVVIDDTRKLQAALNQLVPGASLVVDGSYGRFTRAAVRAFQLSHGLDADGIAGRFTKAALAAALEERHV